MKQRKYADSIALRAIAAGGTVGVLIPPGICFIIYGLITRKSIGTLFMAGIIPGVTQVLFYIITIIIIGKVKPTLIPKGERIPMSEKIKSTKSVWPVILLFLIIMTGIYQGWFTPTEAGAIGAGVSLIITILNRRIQGKIGVSSAEALKNSAMV
ncbi:MAG: TRAP transporter large permease subunit [Oscillospiraceae bacterium]|nr:TRAP transporter large permease subunit [Oscillospiraceae bacterium]